MNKHNPQTKWITIKEDIMISIYKDEIVEHDKILSYSGLAAKYNVDKNTAIKIYKALEKDDLIYYKKGLGYFVKSGAKQKVKDILILRIKYKIDQLKEEIKLLYMSKDDLIKMIWKEDTIMNDNEETCPICGSNNLVADNLDETEFMCMDCGNTFTQEELDTMNFK